MEISDIKFEEYRAELFAYAYFLTKNVADSEDLVQDTFLKVIQKIHLYKPGNFKAWMNMIMHNLFVTRCRKKTPAYTGKPKYDILSDIDVFSDVTEKEVDQRLIKALNSLKSHYREAFQKLTERHSYIDAAGLLNIKKGTFMSRSARGKSPVLDYLKEHFGITSIEEFYE